MIGILRLHIQFYRGFIVVKIQNHNRQSVMQDRYSIIEQKGRNLYKAQRKQDQKTVIIKKISFSSISPKKKQHIVNQVNTLIRMDYIHIIRYLDYEINKKDITVDIVMEYCQGGTLQQLITATKAQGKKISEDQVWRIFYQLVQALDYIHKDSIIHRNISPQNVYFRESQRKNIKLGGFGLSKKLDTQQKFSSTVLPNTHYLSPQQIQTGISTKQTDIWNLGCLMYQVCALYAPFRSSNQFERVKMIKQSKPKKLCYSIELNRLIFWCLQKNPEDRPNLADLTGTPEINLRIRQRRYQEKYAQLINKEERLNRRQKELIQKEEEALKQQKLKSNFESLKRKNSDIQSSRTLNFTEVGLLKNCF